MNLRIPFQYNCIKRGKHNEMGTRERGGTPPKVSISRREIPIRVRPLQNRFLKEILKENSILVIIKEQLEKII